MMKVKLEVLLCALSLCPQAFVFGQGVANDLAGVDKDDIAAMMKRGRKRSVKRSFALRIGHRSEPNFQSRQPRFSEPAKNIANTVNIAGENRDKENRELADFDEAAFWNTYLVGQTDSFPPTGTPPTPHPTTKVETDEPTNAPVSVPMVPTNEPTKSPLPPPTFVPSAVGVPTASPIECKSIAEIACSNPDEFGALCELVNRADLVEPLTNDFLTVFAPTNDALTALPMEVVGPLLEDVGLLREVLWYHVVPSVEIRTTDLVCEGGELDTLTMANGENTTVSCGTRDEPETFILGNGNIEPGAQIIVKNVIACNGIIQVINGVLFPRFTESPTSAPVQQTESPVDVTSAPVAPPTDAPVAPVPDPTPAPVAPPTDAPVAPVPDPTPAPVAPPTDAPVAPVPDPTPAPVAPPTDAPVAPVPDPTPAPVAPPTDAPVAPVPDPTPAPVPPPTNAPTASPTVAPITPTAPPTASPTVAPITPTAPPTASPTVAPTAAPTVAPTLAPTPSPTAAPVPPTPAPIAGPPVVLQAIEPVALQGGSEFTDPNSYQSMALARTEEVPGINDLSSAKIIQYYALYSIFMATNSVSNIITESEGILDIPSWIVSRGWDSTSDPCTGNWFGVECVEDQVTGLNIFNNLLTGAFPPEVTLLASDGPRSTGAGALEVIDLFDNMLLTNNGDNSWWADLGSGFRRLFFRSTAFTGSLGRLPDNIAEFDCSLTFISGGLTNENFQGLNSLRYAELSGNAFNTSVPSAFTQMQSLELLYLQDSFISGDLSYMIGMTSLREHWIDANPGLGGTIPPQLGNIAPLQSLSITSCSLSGSIPPELGNIGGVMQNFWVYDNDLTGTIPAELGSWAGVEILQVEGNSFTGSMPQSVCDRLSFPGRLTTLGADCFDPNFSCDCCTCCSIQECPI